MATIGGFAGGPSVTLNARAVASHRSWKAASTWYGERVAVSTNPAVSRATRCSRRARSRACGRRRPTVEPTRRSMVKRRHPAASEQRTTYRQRSSACRHVGRWHTPFDVAQPGPRQAELW